MTYSARKHLIIPVEAGESIARGQLVKEGTGGNTGRAVLATSTDTLILGVAQTDASSGEILTVALLGVGESQWARTGGAIAQFAEVRLGNSGVLLTEGTGTRNVVGRALEAAASNELVEVQLYPQVDART